MLPSDRIFRIDRIGFTAEAPSEMVLAQFHGAPIRGSPLHYDRRRAQRLELAAAGRRLLSTFNNSKPEAKNNRSAVP